MTAQRDRRPLLRLDALLVALTLALLTAVLWALLNRPFDEPPWPARIQGFALAPLRAHHNPLTGALPTPEDIAADLALLAGKAHAVRSYTTEGAQAEIPRLAATHGLNVTLGAWLGPDPATNAAELERLLDVLRRGYRNVVRVIVGNEALLRGDVALNELIAALERIRAVTKVPVSTAEPWHIWLKYPQLAAHVDFITIHLLPYWEGVPIEQAVDYAFNRS